MAENKQDGPEIDRETGTETTGHEWDGIKELNTPMPRWWLWTFYATVAFSAVYTVLYPAWPGIREASEGVLGWNSRTDLRDEIERADMLRVDRVTALQTSAITKVVADEDLRQFAVRAGQAAFKVNCVQCHGSGAAGAPGYPNLNDDEWIWGGTPEAIYTTLAHGIRHQAFDETRFSEMPSFGEFLARAEISDIAWHVRDLAGLDVGDADPAALERGTELYAGNCASCHGAEGDGSEEFGAPALADAIWLYGSEHEEIAAQVHAPRHGVMPGWSGRLDEATLKALAIYVHSLGGGE